MMTRSLSIDSWPRPPIDTGAPSAYVRPEPVEGRTRSRFDTLTTNEAAPPNPTTLWGSLALRFGGFTANFSALIEPLASPMADAVARVYFTEKISAVAAFAARNPAAAHRLLQAAAVSGDPLWAHLAGTACGDRGALLSAIDLIEEGAASPAFVDAALAVAVIRPLEGRYLLTQLFARADNDARLRILGTFVDDPRMGSSRAIGDLFVKLMARTTPEERRLEIYPALRALVGNTPESSPRHGFLAAMLRGWLSECPPEGI